MTKEEIKNIPNCPGIYSFTNLVNNKRYIGQSIHLQNRLKQHYYSANSSRTIGKRLYDSMKRDGLENFKLEIR